LVNYNIVNQIQKGNKELNHFFHNITLKGALKGEPKRFALKHKIYKI